MVSGTTSAAPTPAASDNAMCVATVTDPRQRSSSQPPASPPSTAAIIANQATQAS